MTRVSFFSLRSVFCLAPVALALALTNCGGGGDEADGGSTTPRNTGGKNSGSGSKSGSGSNGSGSKTGSGSNGSGSTSGEGSNGSGSNGSGSNGSGSNGSGSNGSGSNGSGGGINLGGNGSGGAGGASGPDCNSKDGKTDQEGCSCQIGLKQSCFKGDAKLAGVGLCTLGSQECIPAKKNQGEVGPENVWGPCTGSGVPQTEICGDGVDQNCDGDDKAGCDCQNGLTEKCKTPAGLDGERTCIGSTWTDCKSNAPPPTCTPGTSTGCVTPDNKAGKKTCNPDGSWGSCTPDTTTVCVPTGPEVCDGKDNDCDGKVDGFTDKDGCSSVCLNSAGERTCINGEFSQCTCECTPKECSTICGSGIQICISGELTECQVAPVEQACTCPNGTPSTATCENGTLGACKGCAPEGGTGSLDCQDCIKNECSYEKISAASQQLGNDVSQCKPFYDKFIECIKNTPGSNFFNGPCDQAIGGCDFDCGCGNIIRLAADCASTGNAVGVGQVAKPGGCQLECQ